MEKFTKWVFYIIFLSVGVVAGLKLQDYTAPLFKVLPSDLQFFNTVIFILLGITLGLLFGNLAFNLFIKAIEEIIKKLLQVPPRQIIGGGGGLIIGLIISSLLTFLLSAIPFKDIKSGSYIFSTLIILITIFVSYISLFFGAKTMGQVQFNRRFLNTGHGLDFLWGKKYKVLDTSVIIDGRIYEIAKSRFLEGTIAVPRFVLAELQGIADSADDLSRNKGRRGLDILDTLKQEFGIQILEKDYPGPEVDDKLIDLAKDLQATLITTDYNLNKLATLQGIEVLNINDLANAVKPTVLPGEEFRIRVIKEGKEPGQGIGYFDSGTMVVVENGKKYIGEEVSVEATSCLQTSAGRMIFVKLKQ